MFTLDLCRAAGVATQAPGPGPIVVMIIIIIIITIITMIQGLQDPRERQTSFPRRSPPPAAQLSGKARTRSPVGLLCTLDPWSPQQPLENLPPPSARTSLRGGRHHVCIHVTAMPAPI